MDIKRTIEQCERVVNDWAGRAPSIETVEDFARALGLQLTVKLAPLVTITTVPIKEVEQDGDAGDPESQYELFNEIAAEDKYTLKSWRENNGLAWR